jgi:hypothetical protein
MKPAPLNHRLGHLLVALAVLTLSLCGPAPAQPPARKVLAAYRARWKETHGAAQ